MVGDWIYAHDCEQPATDDVCDCGEPAMFVVWAGPGRRFAWCGGWSDERCRQLVDATTLEGPRG